MEFEFPNVNLLYANLLTLSDIERVQSKVLTDHCFVWRLVRLGTAVQSCTFTCFTIVLVAQIDFRAIAFYVTLNRASDQVCRQAHPAIKARVIKR